jgi:hypothetical protein
MHVDDAISSENPVLHTHAVIFLTPRENGNTEFSGHGLHVGCVPRIMRLDIDKELTVPQLDPPLFTNLIKKYLPCIYCVVHFKFGNCQVDEPLPMN